MLEPLLPLRLRGPEGKLIDINAVIDTGYTGSLTITQALADDLELARRSGGKAILADGSSREFDTYKVEVQWGDSWKPIIASALGDESLIGMSLLLGTKMTIEITSAGRLEIEPLV